MTETYSTKLKEYRRTHRLSQRKMAKKIGCCLSAYSQYEEGLTKTPSDKYADKINAIIAEVDSWTADRGKREE
jgi:transcriptional regulator with XRE-family HTH domain